MGALIAKTANGERAANWLPWTLRGVSPPEQKRLPRPSPRDVREAGRTKRSAPLGSGEHIKTAGEGRKKINLLIKYIGASLTSMNHFTRDERN